MTNNSTFTPEVAEPLAYTLSQAAKATGLAPEDIRAIERNGHIRSILGPGGQRLYLPSDVDYVAWGSPRPENRKGGPDETRQ